MAFQGYLKEDTATTLRLGPFVDKGDGVAYEVGMAAAMNHADTGVRISKNGGALAARTTATEPVYDAFGYYLVNLDATDVGTIGRLKTIFGDAAVCLPCEADFEILPANVFDSLMGTDLLDVSTVQIAGTAQTAGDIVAAIITNAAGVDIAADIIALKAETVEILTDTAVIGALGAGLTALATAAELAKVPKSDGTASWNATALASMQTEANDALIANNLDHLALTATGAADMTTEVADNTILARILGNGDTSTFVPSTDGLHAAGVDIDAILADTNELQVDDYPTSIAAVKADTAAILTDTGTTLDGRIPAALVGGKMDANVGSQSNIDFGALQKASLNAATPASVVGAVGSVTGAVGSVTGAVGSVTGNVGGSVASVTGNVGGNVGSVTGDVAGKVLGGGAGTMTAAGVRAVDASGVNVATAAAVAALNNLSSAQAQAACDAALSAAINEPANLAATKSVKNFLWHLYSRFFHKNTQTATQQITTKADGVTALATRTVSDDGTTQTLGAAS